MHSNSKGPVEVFRASCSRASSLDKVDLLVTTWCVTYSAVIAYLYHVLGGRSCVHPNPYSVKMNQVR